MAGLGTINAAVGGLGDAGRDAATAAAALGCVPTITLNYGKLNWGCFASWNPLPGLCWLEEEKVWKVLKMYEDESRVFVVVLVQPC